MPRGARELWRFGPVMAGAPLAVRSLSKQAGAQHATPCPPTGKQWIHDAALSMASSGATRRRALEGTQLRCDAAVSGALSRRSLTQCFGDCAAEDAQLAEFAQPVSAGRVQNTAPSRLRGRVDCLTAHDPRRKHVAECAWLAAVREKPDAGRVGCDLSRRSDLRPQHFLSRAPNLLKSRTHRSGSCLAGWRPLGWCSFPARVSRRGRGEPSCDGQ